MAQHASPPKRRRDATPSLFDVPAARRATDAPVVPAPARAQTAPSARDGPVPDAAPPPEVSGPSGNGRGRGPETPAPRPAPARRASAESMAARQRDISVSEFFAKNRHLLGFDNKRKALLTTVKEAVDNSLDACEEAGILPDVAVEIDELAEDRFRVTVRDNGPGIVKAQIPNIFGKLLYGSKFHRLKMSRGQQGIGISAAGMYGMLTTGKSIQITSRTGAAREAHYFELQIDTTKNRPVVVVDRTVDVPWPHGTQVSIELAASYARGRQSVDEYLEQTAIANPHAEFRYRAPGLGEHRLFRRSSHDLPPEPKEIKPHPHGIELGVLIKMLKEAAHRQKGERTPSLTGFLQTSFSRVSAKVAEEIAGRAGLTTRTLVTGVSPHQIENLYRAIQATRIIAPPTDCLAPIGARAILAGLLKEVKAEFFTATTRDPTVYRGNPFAVEVGLAFGGDLEAEAPARVIRFANRVPLLYQQSACAVFKTVLDIDWRRYGLSQPSGSLPVGPLVVMVHLASVWVPFTSESKEAIADYDEIRKEIRLGLLECGRKLQAYVNKRRKQRYEGERRSVFERYIAEVVAAVHSIKPVDRLDLTRRLLEIARHRTARADVQLDDAGRPSTPPPAARRRDGDADPVTGDENTVVVERPDAPSGELFEP